MSDSRLEKFIYAICSMDVTDLPVPLSRIEKLWNCLITGEIPDFEPLSRNEKYLMAMLDRYDISNLPAPMSRGEKLLYKIAVGETDLSDVPGYLSRYEELLKYLIENGGIGNFEYVLHTLNQSLSTLYSTAEKPVKSAILKGNTLVNKMNNARYRTSINVDIKPNSNNEFINTDNGGVGYNILPIQSSVFESNKIYTIILFLDEIGDGGLDKPQFFVGKETMLKIGVNKALYTTSPSVNDTDYSHLTQITTSFKARYMIIEGDYTNTDIPYFEGMQSVKMPVLTTTGKNLFNYDSYDWTKHSGGISYNGEIGITNYDGKKCVFTNPEKYPNFSIDFKEKTQYTFTLNAMKIDDGYGNCGFYFAYTDGTSEVTNRFDGSIKNTWVKVSATSKQGKTLHSVKLFNGYNGSWGVYIDLDTIQYEEGSIATSYEPYKTNILTVNEDATLRSNGDICDELNLLTGQLTQRIGEDGVVLSQEVVKTVDLTVVNQDNQPAKLGTFENITHVSLESAGLIPEVAMEVATNLLEDTVFSLTNAFNTLYPTAAKPVKSAILRGQTLKNEYQFKTTSNATFNTTYNYNDNEYTVISDGINDGYVKTDITVYLEANKNYTFKAKCNRGFNNNNGYIYLLLNNSASTNIKMIDGNTTFTVATSGIYYVRLDVRVSNEPYVFSDLMILEGDYTNQDIPYFTGMQSVKMPVLTTTGKNLFDVSKATYGYITSSGSINNAKSNVKSDFILVKGDTSYSVNAVGSEVSKSFFSWFDNNKIFISRTSGQKQISPSNAKYLIVHNNYFPTSDNTNDLTTVKLMVTEGSTLENYEPYKSNILTVNEEVELGSVGGIEDIVDLTTGKATIKTRQTTVTSENVNYNWSNDTHTCFYISQNDMINGYGETVKSNLFPSGDINEVGSKELVTSDGTKNIIFSILNTRLSSTDLSGVINFLEANELNVRYLLATESIKTVDLTVVNQDGNKTKLRTFDDTTHVLLNSEGLIPTAALTVRTKIPSGSSTSLLMNDISTKQEQLNTTVDEQSENVDATMIATTEIYEETL